MFKYRSSRPEVFLRKGVLKTYSEFTGEHPCRSVISIRLLYNFIPKCDFNKVALQLYWNHISAWVLSCRFAAYFQNTFSLEHLWRAAFACIFGAVIISSFRWKLLVVKTTRRHWHLLGLLLLTLNIFHTFF